MRSYLEDDCEGVDAAIFSGDVLYNKDERRDLKIYVTRWLKAIEEHEASLQPGDEE